MESLLTCNFIRFFFVRKDFPDCVFVEDTAIALDHKILITNPGAESRRGETKAVEAAFEQHSRALALEIHQIKNKEEAFVDGGDVCFTGREILVGLSKRTNLKGL
jgi:dimethylargininase